MSRSAIKYLQEIVIIQLNHWVVFPLFLMPMGQLQNLGLPGEPDIWFWAAMSLLPLCFYLLRKCLKHLFLTAFGHLAVLFVFSGAVQTFLQDGKFVYLLFGMGYGVYSLRLRLKRDDMQDVGFFMPLAVGIFFLSSVFVRHLGCLSWDAYYIFTLVFVIGLYFIKSYLDNYLGFVLLNENSTGHIPEREMFVSGSVLALLFTIGSMIFLLFLSNLEWLQGILNLIQALLFKALLFLFSLFSMEMPKDSTDMPPEQQEILTEYMQEQLEATEPFFLWDILFGIMTVFLLCLVLYGLFMKLKRLILFIKSRLYRKNDSSVKTVGSVFDIREKCDTKGSQSGLSRKKFSLWQTLSPRERIRTLYKKHILRTRTADTPSNHSLKLFTAREWGMILGEADMPDIYEKARYSEEVCTAEDVKRMKKACS
ncbi:MAG: hypothetical protein NC251_06610 [Lachnoclostridium sp.]|nr:hypothetical protein [Lachnospira sp.]MCM1248086.1 hypothetical protein [Lachnoclostridium sp.]